MTNFSAFLQRSKSLLQLLLGNDPSYPITKSFALKMLPLSFIAGLFICFAIPASYYYVARQEALKQAQVHAKYVSSFFRQTLETHPLNWKKYIKKSLNYPDIAFVHFFDPKGRLIAKISKASVPHNWFLIVKSQKSVFYEGSLYGYVEVGISLKKALSYTFKLLIFSLFCGSLEGITLFLLPLFEIQRVEERVRKSQSLLLQEQNKLKHSEIKYRTLFELAPDGNVITTEDGQIVSYNPAFQEMLRIPSEEEIAKIDMHQLYLDPKVYDQLLDELFFVGEIRNKEVILKRKDGSELPALISMRLIGASILEDELPPNFDKFVLVFTIIRDISKIKEMEQQLLQAQKLESVGLLAGGIAHDFNNILAAILGYAELLKRRLVNNPLTRYVEAIEKSSLRAAGLVKNLLAFARAGKYQVEDVQINQIIEEVVTFLEHSLEKKIRLVKELQTDLPLIKADPSQLNQVLLNLCINARDALMSQGGGRLILRTYTCTLEERFFTTGDKCEPGQYLAIEVEDNGPGIPEEILEKIFDPFFTTKEPGEGTGLGLSVVYGIVRNHGGYIDVLSRPHKTIFTIYLPLCTEETREEKTSPETKPKRDVHLLKGKTILLIDDEEEVRQMGKLLLEENGYKVILAASGEEGVEIFREKKEQIDLILLDLIMPGRDGLEIFKDLREIDPHTPIVLVTGYMMDKKVRELLAQGAKGFLSKPYKLQEILLIIEEALTKTELDERGVTD